MSFDVAPAPIRHDPPPLWARPGFVALAIALYLLVHLGLRLTMWPTLGIDDAEQALFAQRFALSYRNSAPPLFTWMLVSLGKAMPIDILSISLIRYALLAITYGFTYATARRLIADPRLSALALYSFGALYLFAFYAHHDLTHTTAMTAMLAVAWYVFVRLAEAPRLGWYLALGAVFGLGLLGKWNFLMFAAALPLACLALPRYRPLVLTWKIAPAAVVTAIMVLPTALTVLLAGTAHKDTLQTVLVSSDMPYRDRVLEGLERLALSVVAYPEPLLPLLVLFLGFALWRGLSRPLPPPAPTARVSLALIGWVMGISLALHLALVLALGAREIHERLLQPPLFILPVALFMLIERGRAGARALAIYATMLAVLVAGTFAARIVVYWIGADHCSSCRNMVPFAALSDDLREAGFSGDGTIIADGFHIGGNMRVTFPKARVADSGFPASVWPAPRGDGQCLLLWQVRNPEQAQAAEGFATSYLASSLGGDPDAPHVGGTVSELMFGSETRRYELGYRLYQEPTGDCR